MDSRIFFHYLYSPALHHPDWMWGPRLPWRLNSPLGSMEHGWGIHLEEKPNWPLLAAIISFGLFISGIVAGFYGWKTGDRQVVQLRAR